MDQVFHRRPRKGAGGQGLSRESREQPNKNMNKDMHYNTCSKAAKSATSHLREAKRILDEALLRSRKGSKKSSRRSQYLMILKAAEMGLDEAQYWVGNCYKLGYGVKQNTATAEVWFRRAAKQGYSKAQEALGRMYQKGQGGDPDIIEAFKWFTLAVKNAEAHKLFLRQSGQFHLERAFDYFTQAANGVMAELENKT